MRQGLMLLLVGWLLGGCAALSPMDAALDLPHNRTPPLQVHEETRVSLERDNFVLVKTNVWGQSRGFSLLGLITISPATLTQAMRRLYDAAQMRPGQPQTLAHLVVEQTSSFYLLFGIPKVEVRADIVEFNPEVHATRSARPEPGPDQPPG
jgi:hypothetical protein